jgi:hypothetical protein
MLACGTQVRGFEPGRSRRISQGEKILSMPSFGGEVKPSVPCRRIVACYRTLQIALNSLFVGQITRHFSPTVPAFPARGLSRRCRRGGASWNFQSWARTISVNGCSTFGALATGDHRRRRRRRRRTRRTRTRRTRRRRDSITCPNPEPLS